MILVFRNTVPSLQDGEVWRRGVIQIRIRRLRNLLSPMHTIAVRARVVRRLAKAQCGSYGKAQLSRKLFLTAKS